MAVLIRNSEWSLPQWSVWTLLLQCSKNSARASGAGRSGRRPNGAVPIWRTVLKVGQEWSNCAFASIIRHQAIRSGCTRWLNKRPFASDGKRSVTELQWNHWKDIRVSNERALKRVRTGDQSILRLLACTAWCNKPELH